MNRNGFGPWVLACVLSFLASAVAPARSAQEPEAAGKTVSGQAAAVWACLAEPLAMPFPKDVPLENVLKYVRENTRSDALPQGIRLYVDPQGLQEAGATMQSPVQLDLEGLPLSATLHLTLKQVGLGYRVTDQGLLVIQRPDEQAAVSSEGALMLERLDRLTREVEALRSEVAALRTQLGK